MCGIVGYVGTQQAAPILLEGLSRLEYRGYDSAGICVEQNGVLKVEKAKGRLQNLIAKTENGALLPGTLAALCDETIQLFVPGRSGQITDVWLDTAGYLTGALLTLLIFSLCRKRPKQRKTP